MSTESTPLRWFARSVLALAAVAACSTGKPPDPYGDDTPANGGSSGSAGSGNGGSAASGGSSLTGAGGSAAANSGGSGNDGSGGSATGGAGGASAAGAGTGGSTAASGGASTAGGSGGSNPTGGSAGMTAMAGMAGTDPGICQQLDVVSTPQIPTVELVVDTSSSMWETMPPAWPLLYGALMDPKSGVVAPLQAKMRFGFASYKGGLGTSETDPACAVMTTVDPALNNHDAIDAVYQMVGSSYDQYMTDHYTKPKWETPTDYAINYATDILTKYMPDPPGKKYILLVTDGNPNTCTVVDPQCGQDLAIKATQDAFAAGIGLFVLGLGDIVQQPMNGCPSSARCGLLHLQDLANAGVGAGVQPVPGCDDWHASGCTFTHEQCNVGQMLQATYTPDSPDVGTPYAIDTSGSNATAELVDALTELLNNAVSCTVDMDAVVTGDASLGVVSLDGAPLGYDDANGWKLEANSFSVTLQGTACDAFKKGGSNLSITFPCDPSGNPIAVHR